VADQPTVRVSKYRCKRCDVEWYAREDERVPDVCWLCEKNDETEVYKQCGRPVRYMPEDVGPAPGA
jgi:hypothetical protein